VNESDSGEAFEVRRLERGITLLAARGELDPATAEAFRESLSRAISERTGAVIVDLTRCSFIDSVSIGVLVSGQKAIESRHGRSAPLAVVATRFPARALRLTQVDALIPVYEKLEDALAAVTAAPDQRT
jgi:anti-sigma B factor antagonist